LLGCEALSESEVQEGIRWLPHRELVIGHKANEHFEYLDGPGQLAEKT
jgi:hypothetical protein